MSGETDDMIILFFVFWLILNGKITLELVLIGAVLAAAAFGLARLCFDYSWRTETVILKILPLAGAYLAVLAVEIIKSNLRVMLLVWIKSIPTEPELVRFDTDLKTDAARAILANSISLTPGTITAEVEGDTFFVHCLNRDMLGGIADSRFVKLLKAMEGKMR